MTDYTPTTEEVRVVYADLLTERSGTTWERAEAEFDRWLAQLRKEWKAPIRELHKPRKSTAMFDVCEICVMPIDGGAIMHREYPCPTIQALEGEGK